MLVAVASKMGVAVDEHFGHAKAFDIFSLDPEGARFLERREVAHYCHGNTGDQSAMVQILDTIADCSAVFVARIGDGPTAKLAARGIQAVSDYPWEPIQDALRQWQASAESSSR